MKKLTLFLTLSLLTLIGTSTVVKAQADDAQDINHAEIAAEEGDEDGDKEGDEDVDKEGDEEGEN